MTGVPRKSLRRWRPWKVLLGIFIALILGYFAYQWYQESIYETRLNDAIDATNKVDPHWRKNDLIREYEKLPASNHFGPELLVWRGYLGWFGDDIQTRPGAIEFDLEGKDYNVRFPDPYFKLLRDRLHATDTAGPKVMREQLRLLATESSMSKIPFEDNNLLQRARGVSNYLRDEMELAGHEGRYADLIPLLRSQLQISGYCWTAPKPISQLVGLALRRQGIYGVSRALALGTPTPHVLLQLQQILENSPPLPAEYIIRSAHAEYFDDLEKAGRDIAEWQKMKDSITTFGLSKSPTWNERIDYFWKWLEVEDSMHSLALAKAEVLESSQTTLKLIKTQPENFLRLDPAALPSYTPLVLKSVKNLLARQYVRMIFKLITADAANRAELNSLIVALACERYRLEKGTWPKNLTDLLPAYLKQIPLDPYTGDSVIYRQLTDGIAIYSVGINGIDDGGDVLYLSASPKDRGSKLYHPELRGKKFEEVHPDRIRRE